MKTGVCAILFGLVVMSPSVAKEAKPPPGATDYAEHCAVCHGEAAKGDGPLAWLLKVETPDLTMLARRNGDVFPLDRVYGVIDGRAEVAAHGPRAMPVWGPRFKAMAQQDVDPSRRPLDAENTVTQRIIALIRFLESVQE